MKPLAERIDSFIPRKTVIYRCFKCDANFAMLGDKIKFCYNCGIPIEWDGILTKLEKDFALIRGEYNELDNDNFEKEFVDKLNVAQLGNDFLSLYNEDGSPKDCEYCAYATGTEGCKIPNNKKEIVNIPRRLGYCHSARCSKFKEAKQK